MRYSTDEKVLTLTARRGCNYETVILKIKLLIEDHPRITSLKISDETLYYDIIERLLISFRSYRSENRIKKLQLFSANLGSDAADLLSQYISKNTILTKLDLKFGIDIESDKSLEEWAAICKIGSTVTRSEIPGVDLTLVEHELDRIRQIQTDINSCWSSIATHPNLKSVSIHALSRDSCNYSLVCNVIKTNTVLRSLSIDFHTRWCSEYFNALILSLASNNTLTHFSTWVNTTESCHRVIDGIWRNTKLLSLQLREGNPTGFFFDTPLQYKDKVRNFTSRNQSLRWKNVHRILLDLTLIFHTLPPYIILEIFDWLPNMYRTPHYIKIQLIINVLKSIQNAQN